MSDFSTIYEYIITECRSMLPISRDEFIEKSSRRIRNITAAMQLEKGREQCELESLLIDNIINFYDKNHKNEKTANKKTNIKLAAKKEMPKKTTENKIEFINLDEYKNSTNKKLAIAYTMLEEAHSAWVNAKKINANPVLILDLEQKTRNLYAGFQDSYSIQLSALDAMKNVQNIDQNESEAIKKEFKKIYANVHKLNPNKL